MELPHLTLCTLQQVLQDQKRTATTTAASTDKLEHNPLDQILFLVRVQTNTNEVSLTIHRPVQKRVSIKMQAWSHIYTFSHVGAPYAGASAQRMGSAMLRKYTPPKIRGANGSVANKAVSIIFIKHK